MITSLRRLMIFRILGIGGILSLVACSSDPIPSSTTTCDSNVAQIGVQDGFFGILCGCGEESGKWLGLTSDEKLICTVPPGTTVIFQYIGTTLRHRVISSQFESSPISDPDASAVIRTHVVTLEEEGVYLFSDQFIPGLDGTIVVEAPLP